MDVVMTAYVGSVAVAFLLSIPVAIVAWRHRSQPASRWLVGLMGSILIWTGAKIVSLLVADPSISHLALKVQYVGIEGSTLCFFLFALEYGGYRWASDRRVVGTAIGAAVVLLVLIWTNEFHGWYWTTIVQDAGEPMNIRLDMGWLYGAQLAYAYVLTAGAMAALLHRAIKSHAVYRYQSAAAFTAALTPAGTNVAWQFGLLPFDATPIGFAITGIILALAVVRFGFIDIVPIARHVVVEEINDAMYVVDREDRFVDVNPVGRRMLRIGDESVVGRHASDVLSEYPGLYERYADLYEGDEVVEYQTETGVQYFDVRATRLTDDRDRYIGRIFIVRDVTEQKHRQQTLERQNEQLERFASMVTHDLRNPLAVADARAELAQETGDDEYFEKLHEAHERMETIIDDMLLLAREGQRVSETEPVELEEVATDAWETVETGDASLRVEGSTRFVADQSRIVRLFENLYRNAVEHGSTSPASQAQQDAVEHGSTSNQNASRSDDAIEHAGSAPTVTVGVMDDDADGTAFYVEDDGPGIPDEVRDTIFEYGQTSEDDGTGIGLAIVKQLAEAHGWTVSVADADGGGARFEFTDVAFPDRERAATEL